MTQASALNYLEEHYETFQVELSELLRIPSISRDPACDADMQRAASWLMEKLRSIGCHSVEILPTAGHPVVYGEWIETSRSGTGGSGGVVIPPGCYNCP